jgi:hypothetical protein
MQTEGVKFFSRYNHLLPYFEVADSGEFFLKARVVPGGLQSHKDGVYHVTIL